MSASMIVGEEDSRPVSMLVEASVSGEGGEGGEGGGV